MDIYHIWCNLKEGDSDLSFYESLLNYLNYLKDRDKIFQYRITRRKLGFGPPQLPEYHIMLECENMSQLDAAFENVAARQDPIESLHFAVNKKVKDVLFALYRDFPDENRKIGEEKF